MAPASEAELAEAVADAARARRTLEIVGGDTRAGIGGPVSADERLTTARIDAVTLYEPAALTLVAGAGAKLADIEAMLAAEGQRLPFEPVDHRALMGTSGAPTLGGMVAANASGPARIARGACRDSLIGVRFVDGAGRAIKSGGRVMKNVTGYDLAKMLAGSWGTLGVLSEVSFKVLPAPEAVRTLILRGLDDRAAVRALSAALGSPYDVSGAAHDPAEGGRTLIRVEGFAQSAQERAEALRTALANFGDAEVVDQPELWPAIRDVEAFAGRAGAVWRVSVKPSDGPELVGALTAQGVAQAALYDWGGGLVWLLTQAEGDAGAAAVRAETASRGGHATLIRAPEAIRATVPVFPPEAAPVAALSAALRARFDPHGILNPGRMRAA
ncbi:MAG: FAD-binding protein [Rubrimonas sp.]|uniref:FAD-binding protein n=1 Tax=Rubrimonas sp. TaxID=2036015 RepID=UPI002FDE61B5